MSRSTPKVLYIAGVAHCGSTYLSRVLNQHDDVFTAGELGDIHEQARRGFNSCSCTSSGQDKQIKEVCSTWKSIMGPIRSRINLEKTARLTLTRNREWLTALRQAYVGSIDPEFRKGNRILFHRIQEFTESRIIIDATKSPWRLIPLLEIFRDRMRVLHLVRRPEHQLASKVNRNYNFYRSAFLKYFRKNLLYSLLQGGPDRYFRLRFEQFVQEPQQTLRTLHRWLGLEHEDLFSKPQQDYHHLCGSNAVHPSVLREPEVERVTSSSVEWNLLERIVIQALKTQY